jgi:hypothetical protein
VKGPISKENKCAISDLGKKYYRKKALQLLRLFNSRMSRSWETQSAMLAVHPASQW